MVVAAIQTAAVVLFGCRRAAVDYPMHPAILVAEEVAVAGAVERLLSLVTQVEAVDAVVVGCPLDIAAAAAAAAVGWPLRRSCY